MITSNSLNWKGDINSKWRAKYLALFAVGATALGLVDANKTLAIFFSAPFWRFLQIFAKRVYESNFHVFGDFNFRYFAHCAWCFDFFVFHLFWGGYLIRKGVCILDIGYFLTY